MVQCNGAIGAIEKGPAWDNDDKNDDDDDDDKNDDNEDDDDDEWPITFIFQCL